MNPRLVDIMSKYELQKKEETFANIIYNECKRLDIEVTPEIISAITTDIYMDLVVYGEVRDSIEDKALSAIKKLHNEQFNKKIQELFHEEE